MNIIDEYINKLEDSLNNDSYEAQGLLVKEVVATFSECIPTIKTGLDRYKGRIAILGGSSSYTPPKYDNAGDIRKLMGKLRVYQESNQTLPREQNEQKEVEKKHDEERSITIIQNANPNVMQTQNVTMSVSFSQVISAIDLDGLNDDDVMKIKTLLTDAEANRGNESKLRQIGREVADFAFEKAKASLPIILGYLSSLF